MFSAFRTDVKGNRHPLLSRHMSKFCARASRDLHKQKIVPSLAGVDNAPSDSSLLFSKVANFRLLFPRSCSIHRVVYQIRVEYLPTIWYLIKVKIDGFSGAYRKNQTV